MAIENKIPNKSKSSLGSGSFSTELSSSLICFLIIDRMKDYEKICAEGD